MTQFAAVALLLGFFLPSSVVALGSVPTCNAGFNWTFNSLNQSPCTIASALGEACTGVDFPIPPLDATENYLGPIPTAANQCRCSSVFYDVLSACAVCQGAIISTWNFYAQNCTTVLLTVFPLPIPSGFPVPHYAYLDPTANGMDTFNPALAEADTGPESTALPQPTSATNTAVPTSSTGSNGSTATGQKSKKKSNAGAIAGGVVGGIAALAIIAGLAAWLVSRSRRQQRSPPIAFDEKLMVSDGSPNEAATLANTPAPKLYDPNDPSTFPGNNGSFGTSMYSSVPSPAANSGYFPSNQPISTHNTGHTGYAAVPNVLPVSTHSTGQGGYTGMAEVM
ncbi:hypothetical protein BJ912DRAFT_1137911 [Pholiota molesta]|nr:hypothetical protein BJ912DRAFT_1137911 [Pholiota molesta]